MSSFWHKHRTLFVLFTIPGLLLLLLVMLEAWPLTAGPMGTLDARFDLWCGHYAIHTYGLNLWRREYARILKDRYGIKTHIDAFCLVSKSQNAFADSYNKLSTAAANRKFGHDIFNECGEEAEHEWEVRRAQALGTK